MNVHTRQYPGFLPCPFCAAAQPFCAAAQQTQAWKLCSLRATSGNLQLAACSYSTYKNKHDCDCRNASSICTTLKCLFCIAESTWDPRVGCRAQQNKLPAPFESSPSGVLDQVDALLVREPGNNRHQWERQRSSVSILRLSSAFAASLPSAYVSRD